jgi:hypothetical protein
MLTFNEYVFTMIDCKNEYRGDFIDTKTALDVLHTSSKDNDRFVDNIDFDRATIERISSSQAKREAKNNPNRNKLKPAETKFLTSFKLHKTSNLDLRKLFEESITDSVEKKEFERIVRKGNKEIKEQGVFNISTLSDMDQLIKKLQHKETDSRVISGTRGVLYYAGKK